MKLELSNPLKWLEPKGFYTVHIPAPAKTDKDPGALIEAALDLAGAAPLSAGGEPGGSWHDCPF
jgi:hypothetical protein